MLGYDFPSVLLQPHLSRAMVQTVHTSFARNAPSVSCQVTVDRFFFDGSDARASKIPHLGTRLLLMSQSRQSEGKTP